ncbi:MAG: ABC transporter ATP-binding protein/permease [Agathobacter sp.]|uniref:ABC transporter ATP-binding protein/permease n=1 Tax=Agathobacter sp. TaxID=2021311 RepID=UPI002E7688BB|nr:ABC transporter ATP-binding protein/permease [Agathobacter sp.]MEE1216867.1 ABC transporter ATP-binding protein/permease [Agathobacter sp.]
MIKIRLVGLLSHAKKYIVYTILWQWAALLSQVVAVFTIAGLQERVVYRAVTISVIEQTILILVLVVVIRFVCERMGARSSYLACVDVKRILREKIYEKMLRLGASYSEQVSSSEVVQVSTEGVEQLETYFGKYLPQLFYSLIAPLTLFIILCRVSLKASIILLICVPLIPISIVVVQKVAKRLLNNYWSIYTGLGDSFLENLQGLTTLKIYQADKQKADEMDVESQNFRRITMKVLTMQLNSTSVMDIVAYGGAAIGMAASVSEFLKGNISVTGTLCIVLLASEFFLPLRLLGSFFHIAMNGMAASDKIFKILDLPEPQAGEKTLPDGALDVTLKDVHFSYEKDREILKGISLNLPAGSFVSLVGESGCGKSTIAGILAAKNRGYSGEITIGGIPLNELNEADLMKHVVLVRHNSYLFKGTVEENMKMAKPDATKEEMEAVLKKVNLLGFLQTQDGLQTKLQEKASNLSGGQCQRLVIARALLKPESEVYIFDEAASNIDVESEELIMNVIHELAKTKTVLLISHRLANVVKSDKIYFLKDGEIKESGKHDELMSQNGAYRHLYESQMALENYGKKVAV